MQLELPFRSADDRKWRRILRDSAHLEGHKQIESRKALQHDGKYHGF